MSSRVRREPGYLKQLWYSYKALRLPWRKNFLVGADLAGNTFWEFKDALNAGRLRRMVRYARETHYADVKISPQWHQWLRHTRPEPPSLQEQQYEVSRQQMMKQLAARADERWRSVPSFLDAPDKRQTAPATAITDSKPENAGAMLDADGRIARPLESAEEQQRQGKTSTKPSSNPWVQGNKGAPSENWQPEKWTPGVSRRG